MTGWDLSRPDWEARIREGRPLIDGLPLDRVEADKAVKIFNKLRLPDVEGQPALADAAGDWFRDIVAALFGSTDPATGERMIREIFCMVPKKNSKTTCSAAIMLTALLRNRRPRAEFLLIGPTKLVSDLAFDQAAGMIAADDGFLQKRLHVRDHLKTIVDRKTKAELLIKSFDTSVLTGVKPAGALIDEEHEIAKDPAAEKVMTQLRGGMIANPEAFLVIITTQSDGPPMGAFAADLEKARAIRDGLLTGVRTLPVLYEFPRSISKPVRSGERAPWLDPAIWPWVNPNIGRSVTLGRLQELFAEAQSKGEAETRRWASQHLNIEIGLAIRHGAWAGAAYWEDAAEPGLSVEEIIERCDVATIGVDGGGLDDLLGLAVIGRERDTRRWLHWGHAWAHRSVLDLRKSEAAKMQDMEAAGELTLVDVMGDDIAELGDIVEQVFKAGLLPRKGGIGLDPVGVGSIVDDMSARGIPDGMIVGISQGWKLNGAIKTVERKLVEGAMAHAGQSLMAWCVGNAKAEPKGNAVTITKQASGTGKIDPLMALFDAAQLMSLNPRPSGMSYIGQSGAVVALG